MKWILILLVPLGVGSALLVAQDWPPELQIPSANAPVSRPSAEPTAPVSSRDRKIFASGFVEGARRNVSLQFEVEGRLTELAVEDGESVQRGDVLARLDAGLWKDRLAEAQASLDLAKARKKRLVNAARPETIYVAKTEVEVAELAVQTARKEFQRGERLFGRGAITQNEWDEFQHQYETAKAELERARARAEEVAAPARKDELEKADAQIAQARAQVQQAQTMLEKARLTAPQDGVILRIDAEPGELVGPERPTPLITMTDLSELRVRAYVEELDALAVEPGRRAWVTADGRPGQRYAGTVIFVSPFLGEKRHRHHKPGERLDVKVREVLIRLRQPEDLVVGLPVEVFIERGALSQRGSTLGSKGEPSEEQGPAQQARSILERAGGIERPGNGGSGTP